MEYELQLNTKLLGDLRSQGVSLMLDKLYRTNIILLMSSEKLISIEELVKRAKKQGVDFGKTDPYNRLRTKVDLGGEGAGCNAPVNLGR